MRKTLLTFVFAFLSMVSFAQVTNTFNFTADLSAIIGTGAGKFDPATDSIRVMGMDWDGNGVFISGNRTMARQGTTAIYKTSLVVQRTTTDTTGWKFKAFPDARFVNSGWENIANNRLAIFGANGATIDLPTIAPVITPIVVVNVFNTINFTADLSNILFSGLGNAFDPAQDSILVQGLDWEGGTNVTGVRKMTQDPFSPGIYRTSLTVQKTGDSTKWKFRAFPTIRFSNDGWETGADNWYLYGPDGFVANLNEAPRIYPKGAPLSAPLDVFFRVDMTGAKNRYNNQSINLTSIQFVGMRGGTTWLGSWASGNWLPSDTTTGNMKVLNDAGVNGDLTAGDNIWSRMVTLPAGTDGGFYEYKYCAMYPGADTINGGSSPLDNEGGFGLNHGIFLKNGPSIIMNNMFGAFTTAIRELENMLPQGFDLSQNYPNPFNPSTKIRYSVTTPGLVNLRVFDILGNEVGTIINQEQTAGVYEVDFTAINLASGVYLYKLQVGGLTQTKKMMIMK